jgi:hypothetical protein
MKQIQSSGFGCGFLLITVGVLGLLSTVVNLGSSNRAIFQIFFELAKNFGSVTTFSLLTIGVGVIVILVIMLIGELTRGETDTRHKR